MKKYLFIALLVAMFGLVTIPVFAKSENAKGPAPKVDVCHFEGNGSYHVINVSENAVPAHLEHGDILAGTAGVPVSGMDEGYYYTDICEYEFVRSAVITSPAENDPYTEYDVGEEVDFIAHLVDMDKDDSVSWAVRFGTCNAATNTVFGNVDGFHDDYDWDHTDFSAVADTTGWEGGDYCFIFNPTESVGDTSIRETRWFTLIAPVEPTRYEHTAGFNSTGWAGWSCPLDEYAVGAGVLVGTANTYLWEPGASAGGFDYPATPFGYTYGTGETGMILQNDGDGNETITYYVDCLPKP